MNSVSDEILTYVGAGLAVVAVIILLTALAFFFVRQRANQSTSSWSATNRDRPLPRQVISVDSPSSDSQGSSRLPQQGPTWHSDTDKTPVPFAPLQQPVNNLRDTIESHIVGLKQAGYEPEVKELPDHSFVLVISTYLPSQEQKAYIYLCCGTHFPDAPPVPVTSVVKGFDERGELQEQEVVLSDLKSISNWRFDSALWRVIREIEAQLDVKLVESSQTSSIFTKYGEIIQAHSK